MISGWWRRRRAAAEPGPDATISEAHPAPAVIEAAPPVFVGAIEAIDGRCVAGIIAADGDAPVHVEFTSGDRRVGEVKAKRISADDADPLAFKTELDINRAAEIQARRRSDGAELSGSPFQVGGLPTPSRPSWDVPAQVVKDLRLVDRREAALFATASHTGTIKPHVAPYIAALRQAGIAVVLIAATDRALNVPPAIVEASDAVLVREDGGTAFGAWAHALHVWPVLWGLSTVYLLDDSVVGPSSPEAFEALLARVRASDADMVALTESHDHGWHPQRFFMALKPHLLASGEVQQFWGEADFADEAQEGSCADELALTKVIADIGARIEVLFPSISVSNPIVEDAHALLLDGLPFLALDAVPAAGEEFLYGQPGLGRRRIDAALAANRSETALSTPDHGLLVRARAMPAGGSDTLRLAFHGPWDQGGANADVTRAMLAALQRTTLPLNIVGVPPPEPSQPIAITDFAVPPDVTVAALPMSRDAANRIPHASLRIGWWMPTGDPLPNNGDIGAVDELWVTDADLEKRLRGMLDVPVFLRPLDDAAALTVAIEAARARRRPAHPRQPDRLRPSLLAGCPIASERLTAEVVLVPLEPDGSIGDTARDACSRASAMGADEWLAFAPAGSLRSPLFAQSIAWQVRVRPDAALLYADDIAIAIDSDEPIDQLRLKPDFDLTLLSAQDYVGAPLAIRASALARLAGPDPARGTAAMADLLFRADAAGLPIARIPEVLLAHPGRRVRARNDDYLAMLRAQPQLAGFDIAAGLEPNSFVTSRRFAEGEEPAVTLVIPTMRGGRPGEPACIERLLDALCDTDWPMDRLSVLVGDDIAGEPDWARRPWPFALRRIETPRAEGERFNYAAKMNRLWREAGDEQLVLMNDDVMPLDGGWLRALQTFATQDRVGGVGARLLFEDGTLQHVGIVPHNSGAAHAWIHRSRLAGTYQGWARVHREWSMVTGALFATRRSMMERMNGFDERFSLEFNDTDLCMRMRALGYRIVSTPHAELVHREKVSRGHALPPGDELALFRSRWLGWLDQDPSWHPGLRRDRLQLMPKPADGAWYL